MFSREDSGLLKHQQSHYSSRLSYKPADWQLSLSFLPPHNGEVEIDPEQDVDEEAGDEGLRNVGDLSFS